MAKAAMRLTKKDCDYILECLGYTKRAYEEYAHYPSPEFREQQLSKLAALMTKLKDFTSGGRDG